MEKHSFRPSFRLDDEEAVAVTRAKLFQVIGLLYDRGVPVWRHMDVAQMPDYQPYVFLGSAEWEFAFPKPQVPRPLKKDSDNPENDQKDTVVCQPLEFDGQSARDGLTRHIILPFRQVENVEGHIVVEYDDWSSWPYVQALDIMVRDDSKLPEGLEKSIATILPR